MATRIRLQRHGRRKRAFYHIVIADTRAPRDGKFIEKIGTYDPNTVPATIIVDRDRAFDWVMKGAQPTDTVRAILRYNGVLYRKHLQRGVRKGAFSQEEADKRYEDWLADKAQQIAGRKDKLNAAELDAAAKQAVAEEAPVVEEAAPVVEETPAPVVEETPSPVVEEVAAVVEETPVPVVEETPAPVVEEVKPDDLTKIEGIGPKISSLLIEGGYKTFADLAKANVDDITKILADNSLAQHIPTTWAKQAEMAAAGKWDELKKWQDELDGGKVVE
ncbi:UNVERIFIED_CONTAM: hypothetical protein GTU68_000892 [Idotea baltica]|nr:hypothetical protein [Idotea baltica]